MSRDYSDDVNVPEHVGLILDGNRRWAKEKGLPSLEGHRKGFDNLKSISIHALNRGVKYLSAYVFSTENWDRTQEEINYLMDLLISVVGKELDELHSKGIKVVFLGSPDNVSSKVQKAIKKAEDTTKDNQQGTLALCFNYGGQQEVVDAVRKIVQSGVTADKITPEVFSKYIYRPEVPPIDLIIRTSGEKRLSNFMMWRSAYSELYFSDKYWPDFSPKDLDEAIEDYSKRTRRLGK